MCELVVTGKGKLQGDTKSLYSHDRDRAHRGANAHIDERVLLAMDWGNLVDHNASKDADEESVEQKPFRTVSG